MAKQDWIKKALGKPGELHKALGVPLGQKIPKDKLDKAAHAPGKLGREARLAETLEAMHKNTGVHLPSMGDGMPMPKAPKKGM